MRPRPSVLAGFAAALAAGWLLAAGGGGDARADTKVLQGVPTYVAAEWPGPAATAGETPRLTVVGLDPSAPRPILSGPTLPGAPEYQWWYGCAPTAAGMLAGYWDGQPGRGNLFDGDARTWYGDQDTGTKAMVASRAHITAGIENGRTYGDFQNSPSYPQHLANPECVADFLRTVDGNTYPSSVAPGLEQFIAWDNPRTALHEGLPAQAARSYVPAQGGLLSYSAFKAEIDAGRPVLLNLWTAESDTKWVGHTVVAYGYQDDLFKVQLPTESLPYPDVTVGGFAVRDTWLNGTALSEWVDWDENTFPSLIDENGVEWWPFIEFADTSWVYDKEENKLGPYDWMVSDGVTLYVVPEPATALLVAAGAAMLAWRGRRHRARRASGGAGAIEPAAGAAGHLGPGWPAASAAGSAAGAL
ncbi:MAG: PEP-CTERM sorting domain-containing protein [Planctomycetes bacterium]|nr:PEP-CTERM sorting domain-containing protein [Planctomycetota bacterium]